MANQSWIDQANMTVVASADPQARIDQANMTVVWAETAPGNTYEYTRALALIQEGTSKVTTWLIEMTATDPSDGQTGKVLMTIPVVPGEQKVFASWAGSEVKALADAERTATGWDTIADAIIVFNRETSEREAMDPSLLV